MVPSKTLEQEDLEEAQSRLAKIKESLSEQDIDNIIQNTVTLKQIQAAEDSPEASATIPKLSLEDLTREVAEYPIEVTESQGVTVVKHEMVSTSGIAYAEFGVDISGVSTDDIVLLPIFTRILMET